MKGVAQENQHLDFKLLSTADFGKDDKRNFGVLRPTLRNL
jgi:hypothetical protein